MDSQKFDQFKANMEQEIDSNLNNSNIAKYFEDRGLGDAIVTVQFMVDLPKVQSSNTIEPEIKDSLMTMGEKTAILARGCFCGPIFKWNCD